MYITSLRFWFNRSIKMILAELKYFPLVSTKSTVLLLSNSCMQSHLFFHCFLKISTKEKLLHPTLVLIQEKETKFIDQETFNMSFNKILSLPIVLYYKAFFFEQFIRTLPSKNKLFKYGFAETNLCLKCNVLSSTEHNIFYCKFPTYS